MKILIIGGGIAGLMAAAGAKKANPDANVKIIEHSSRLGGLLAGIEYPEQGLYYDLGTHIFQETGISDYDTFILNALPEEDRLLFPLGRGDLSGSVFNGRLQKNVHFPDLRQHGDGDRLIGGIKSHISELKEVKKNSRCTKLFDEAAMIFGREYANEVICPILAHVFQLPAERLSAFSLWLPGVTRVVIDDYPKWLRSATDNVYRSVSAVPDQRMLPNHLRHTRRSFYSKRSGSKGVIDGIALALTKLGVEIILKANVAQIDLQNNTIGYKILDKDIETAEYDQLILAVGAIGAAHLLKLDVSGFRFDKPMPHWLLNLQLKGLCSSDLCYIYGLDKGCEWYRVTNYKAFSGDQLDRRLTVEIIGRETVDIKRLPMSIVEQLTTLGLIESSAVDFVNMVHLPSGFPSPTQTNILALQELGSKVSKLLPSNAALCGIGSSGGLFFQNEVAPDAYQKAFRLIDKGFGG